jgi:prophage regulatory protein
LQQMSENEELIIEDLPKSGYIRLPEVLTLLGISRSTFYTGIKTGKYPKPVKIGKRVSTWKAGEIKTLATKLQIATHLNSN